MGHRQEEHITLVVSETPETIFQKLEKYRVMAKGKIIAPRWRVLITISLNLQFFKSLRISPIMKTLQCVRFFNFLKNDYFLFIFKVQYFMYLRYITCLVLRNTSKSYVAAGKLPSYNHMHKTHFLFICTSIHHPHKESIYTYEGLTLLSHHDRQQREYKYDNYFPLTLDITSLRTSRVSKINTILFGSESPFSALWWYKDL